MDKILVVDDSKVDRELLREMLLSSDVKYDIQEAESGQTALDLLGQDPPDLILLDIQMSDINGFSILEELRKRKDLFVPVLLVSAFTGKTDRMKGIELGATDFINKPLIPEEVLARVASQIKIKKMHDDSQWVARETNEAIKLLYKEMEKKNEELKRLDKLKSDFVSTVSHELRTPLAITTEGLSLVIDGIAGPTTEKQKEILTTSYDNINRLSRIINDLLDISKIEAGKIEIRRGFVDFKKLLKDLVDSYQPVVKLKKIELSLKLPSKDLSLYIDGDKIIQVMNNLLNNAYKFSEEGKKIEVEVSLRESDVLCQVKDSGLGIAKEDMKKLFSKFQQFGRKEGPGVKGTGLGLVITQALVKLHGGDIWCESEAGKGSTFFFTLPAYDALRRKFEEDFDVILQEAKAQTKSCAFMIVELHNRDEILKACGAKDLESIMNSQLSKMRQIVTYEKDMVFLFNDHRIYVVMPDTKRNGAVLVNSRIRVAMDKLQHAGSQGVSPDIKVGVAIFPTDGSSKEDLIIAAEENMMKRKTVLIVDDHPQIVRILSMRLESRGYDTQHASNGKEALKLIHDNKPKPDIIILDVMMPEMNGYEVYGRLKEHPETSHIPIVLLTAHDVDMGKIELITPGYVPIIQKTGGFENLVDVINQL